MGLDSFQVRDQAPSQVKLLSYRFGKEGAAVDSWAMARFLNLTGGTPYTFLAFQDCDPLVPQDAWGMVSSQQFRLCLAYRKHEWQEVSHGETLISADSVANAHTERGALWIKLLHESGQNLLLVNYEGPRPFNSGGVCGGTATAKHLLKMAQQVTNPGDGILIVGDFHADYDSSTLATLRKSLPSISHGTCTDAAGCMVHNFHAIAMQTFRHVGLSRAILGEVGALISIRRTTLRKRA